MKNLLLLLLLISSLTYGQDFPKKPTNYVTDAAYILSQRQEEILNSKLRAFEERTSNQLLIYVDDRYAGDLEDYSKEIFNTWGIGQKDKNNGILIAIFISDREYRIQVGYGLEAALPSDLTLKIQDEDMQSHFKEKNYFEGIDAGIDQLIYYSQNEYVPPTPFEQMRIKIGIIFLVGLVFFIINLSSLKPWDEQPKRKRLYRLLSFLFLIGPVVLTIGLAFLKTTVVYYVVIPSLVGSLAQLLLGTVFINDTGSIRYDYETDDAYERRMERQRATSSDSSSDDDRFSGGGGGSSDRGGSSSSW